MWLLRWMLLDAQNIFRYIPYQNFLIALLHNMLTPMWLVFNGTHQCVPPGSMPGLVIFDVFINGLCVSSEGEEFDGEAEECSVEQMGKI